MKPLHRQGLFSLAHPIVGLCFFFFIGAQAFSQTTNFSDALQNFYSGEASQSAAAFRELVARHPDSLQGNLFLARSLQQQAFSSGLLESRREIIKALVNALQLDPGSNEIYRDIGHFYLLFWELGKAQHLFKGLIEREPDNLFNVVGGIRVNVELQNATEARLLYFHYLQKNAEQLRDLYRRVQE